MRSRRSIMVSRQPKVLEVGRAGPGLLLTGYGRGVLRRVRLHGIMVGQHNQEYDKTRAAPAATGNRGALPMTIAPRFSVRLDSERLHLVPLVG